MTIFEYLAIDYSLVISFAVMRGLAGLPHAASPGRRYWVHLACHVPRSQPEEVAMHRSTELAGLRDENAILDALRLAGPLWVGNERS